MSAPECQDRVPARRGCGGETTLATRPCATFRQPHPPILFDEWQVEPSIWNRVRRQVDDRQACVYVLTGSATPADDGQSPVEWWGLGDGAAS